MVKNNINNNNNNDFMVIVFPMPQSFIYLVLPPFYLPAKVIHPPSENRGSLGVLSCQDSQKRDTPG